jgi:hypothetical protein
VAGINAPRDTERERVQERISGITGGQNRPIPAKKVKRLARTTIDLLNERNLTQRVRLSVADESDGAWRIEPQGLRLTATAWMTSKNNFEGDFVLDMTYFVARSDGHECKVEVSLWGVTVVASGRRSDGPKSVRIQRKGNQIICTPVGGQSETVIIKEEFKNKPSDFTIKVYRHRQYSGAMDVLFRSIEYQGRLVVDG